MDCHVTGCVSEKAQANRRQLISISDSKFRPSRRTHSPAPMLLNAALRRAPAGIRSFSSTVKPAASEPIMNRYSRTITQPKAQGASQVRTCCYPDEVCHFRH